MLVTFSQELQNKHVFNTLLSPSFLVTFQSDLIQNHQPIKYYIHFWK